MNPQKMDKFFSPLPQRRQLRLGDKAVLVGIELVEKRGGEFVFAEFAVVVRVALLEGAACTASAGSVLDVVQVMPSVPEVSA